MSRVRIVTEPHTDYIRWIHSLTWSNVAAGEDIRWLPRDRATELPLTDDDYWLFDDRRVILTTFDADDQYAGGVEVFDSHVIERCRAAYEAVWAVAIPHNEYA